MKLSICIPTIPTRRSLLSRLLHTLEHQLTPDVEVLIADGIAPMGDKLNECFARAAHTYVVCIDDDDLVADDFVAVTTRSMAHLPDFIGYRVLVLENGRYVATVKHSLDGDPKWSGLDRGVSPKCLVRTDIAQRVPFRNDYHADRAWSQAVHELCSTGRVIDRDLYVYDHWNDHMVGTSPDDPRFRRPQRDVGLWPFTPEAFTWLA